MHALGNAIGIIERQAARRAKPKSSRHHLMAGYRVGRGLPAKKGFTAP